MSTAAVSVDVVAARQRCSSSVPSTVLLAVCQQLQSVWTWSQGTGNTGCCVCSASRHQTVSSPSRQQLKRDPVTAVRHKHSARNRPIHNLCYVRFRVLMAFCVEVCPMKRNFAGLCQRFGEACCPHLQG